MHFPTKGNEEKLVCLSTTGKDKLGPLKIEMKFVFALIFYFKRFPWMGL